MCFKKNNKIDIEKGRRIFFDYKGDSFGIDRDIGPEYWNCHIPEHMEEQWRKEIAEVELKESNDS